MDSFNDFLYRKLFLFTAALCFSFSTYMLPFFNFMSSLLRFKVTENSSMAISEQNIKHGSSLEYPEWKENEDENDICLMDSSNDGVDLKEESHFSFKFKFPTYEEFSKNKGDFEACSAPNTSKYEFSSCKSYSGIIIEPKALIFRIKEVNKDTNLGFELNKEITKDSSDGVIMIEENVQASNAEKCLVCNDKDNLSKKYTHLDPISTKLIDSYDYGCLRFDPLKIEDENTAIHRQNVELSKPTFLSEKESVDQLEKRKKCIDDCSYDSENLSESLVLDYEETNKLEMLWEHQELIEQLKMEIKKVRAIGLPTILEEMECPKVRMEDLKPWKIDDKFQHENPLSELHKLYRSYRERMRKFDILNYQKMYALGFVQLKNPLQSIPTPKFPTFEFKSFLSNNFYPQKFKKGENDTTTKFIKELHSDLEVVYVGQMCLSWEFLHWQYCKALNIWESDVCGKRKFNEVAGEFQQFQVLMQRFIEDEPFSGPRVQNYVKTRFILRNLLQVPIIREDSLKDKMKEERNEYVITSDMLVEIIEESIRIFWKFVRADKDCKGVKGKVQKETQIELQDPADSELLGDVLHNLEKKERKLKEQLRSGNCILRRLKKRKEEDNSDQVLYFFSQVDMKIVRRVLNISRLTTEQLVWCHNKLGNISLLNRKIHLNPSFLLFPC